MLDDEADGNLVRYFFAHPTARRWHDWSAVADMVTLRLRMARSIRSDDGQLGAIIAALQSFPKFECRWPEHCWNDFRSSALQVGHPLRGCVEVEFETQDPAADQGVQV
ncbi:hypothetical protein [Nocardia transvalensis]|uniref:MmyB family transcriptional regulator n=1 Tax=Nocardia transvalensis TaxID=37333 RepID=UPI0018951744|nr:hypothetical protein [Nocardia transvalensis]MBF6326921.1 hypothetical protein [Nocardia transvalensis]